MKHIVIGTAGHIDHGKTALVRALTGIDTDRLEEEKRRGISIDLGFAHLALSEQVRIAFIDVPGHEKFIKNMLAGVGGIDAVLFIVASDESIKPQTREHFEICRLLRIPRGIIALTKSDLADEEMLELVRLEVREFVSGSFLEAAPVVPVSVVTGNGMEQLRDSLVKLASEVPPRSDTHLLRIPVDRSFVMQGFGTVTTGTVVSDSVLTEQEVETYPGGHILRVRGLQVHGKPAKRASAGQRAALNVAGIDHNELRRGMVLGPPGSLLVAQRLDCSFELLKDAKPLKDRAPVHFHSGTAESEGEIRTLDGSAPIQPGAATFVRIILREPLLLVPGDRYIVRMFSPVVTIGGGTVLDTPRDVRLRRSESLERARALAASDIPEHVALLVRESRGGISLHDVSMRTGLKAAAVRAPLAPGVLLLEGSPPWLLHQESLAGLLERWRGQLRAFHTAHPLLPGIRREEMRSREMPDAPAWVFEAMLAREKQVASTGDVLRLTTHKMALKQDEEEALRRIESAWESAGLRVPGTNEVLGASGVDLARARSLLQILLRDRRLVRIAGDLVFHPAALASLREDLRHRQGQRFSVGDFKDWTGISRKYAIPLLEHLDRERVTRREGDARVVL